MVGVKEHSSAYEVLSVIVPSFFLVFIATTSCTFYRSSIGPRSRFMFEFVVVVVPTLLNITVLVPYMPEVLGLLIFISINLVVMASRYAGTPEGGDSREKPAGFRCFVTNLRATINLLTAIAILAVDFKVFPRQFSKRLKYGYSLMDVGVGLFVYANGLVAPEIRGYKNTMWKTFKDTLPLLIIGWGRYFTTHVAHYHVSVTEYGVHWNFFITLAVTRLLSSLILKFIDVKHSALTGVALLLLHETILQMGLAEYVFSDAKRDNFFSANREGITSSLGFVALYFLSVSVGILIDIKQKQITSSNRTLLLKLSVCSFVLFASTFYLETLFDISRRTANSVYCLWTLSLGVFMLGLFYAGELFQRYLYEGTVLREFVHVPLIMDAINYNGLFYFLIANILTGVVNMTFQTLTVRHFQSICILLVYMCLTCTSVCILYSRKIKLKL